MPDHTLKRRSFLALASGLFVPWEPERVYSFLPAWRLIDRTFFEDRVVPRRLVVSSNQEPDQFWIGRPAQIQDLPPMPGLPGAAFTWRNRLGVLHPSNVLDVRKSAEAYGLKLEWFS